jgi:hypothetical protein
VIMLRGILDSHTGFDEDSSILEYEAVLVGK